MRMNKVDISQIQFQYCEYNQNLYDSILRIGFSFPIYVNLDEEGYKCIDGHKRLSALSDILKTDPHYKRGRLVSIVVKNNADTRSNDCWRGRNTH